MFERALISYAIVAFGTLFVSFGMILNGGDSPGNPAWVFVSTLRNILLLPIAIVTVGILLMAFWEAFEQRPRNLPHKAASTPLPPSKADPDQEAARVETEKRAAEERARRAEERRRIEEERKREEEEGKRQAEEKRRTRSAEDAAQSGLGDFL